MRRQVKSQNSEIQQKGLVYPNNRTQIANILFAEQKGFCAYTEEYIERTDAEDIEHFNPTLKGTDDDGYENWFLVKHQWNSEKSTKWE
ncbi:MAG TPA: HNH endonuclease domain-containing protein [Saprospiraceae bacterium]|nr:HNH endonuclease domain-containing protein [Saprospiraceae bacterium]